MTGAATTKPTAGMLRWYHRLGAAGVTLGLCAAHHAVVVAVVLWVHVYDGDAVMGVIWLAAVALGLVRLGAWLEAVTRRGVLAAKDATIAAQTDTITTLTQLVIDQTAWLSETRRDNLQLAADNDELRRGLRPDGTGDE